MRKTDRPSRTIAAVVAGTGFEGREHIIRRFCKEGSPVQLRREPRNPHDADAIAVWLECPGLFGLFMTWKKIGYIRASRADGVAKKVDSGKLTVDRAFVRSFYAPPPPARDHPRVSLQLEVSERT